jgi:translation initiation factor IF-2
VPRSCTVCSHPEREAIDRALVGDASNRSVASLYDVSEAAVRRHKAKHLPTKLAKAHEAEEVARADELLRQVRSLQSKTLNILLQAESAGDLRTALSAVREARGNVELLAKLSGELDESPVVNVLISPEWLELRAVIVGALEPHSEARGAVLKAIAGTGNGGA